MLVVRELRELALARSVTLGLRLAPSLLLATVILSGCRLSEPASGEEEPETFREVSLPEHLGDVEKELRRIEPLDGEALNAVPDERRRRGRHLRDELVTRLKSYVALLEGMSSERREPTAAGLDLVLRECVDLGREVTELARRYRDWLASLRELEAGFSARDHGRDEIRRAREYVKLSAAIAELFSQSGDQLAGHHETRLLRPEEEPPALTALHFLVLERLGKGGLDRHVDVLRRAWARWLHSQQGRVGPAAALGVVAAGFRIDPRYRPVSLSDMTRVVQTCLRHTPSLPEVYAMEVSLSTIEQVFRSEVAGEAAERGDFRRARAVLRLSLARRVADPIEGIRLAVEAERMDARLAGDVELYLHEAGRKILEQGAARRRLGEAFQAYVAALEENDVAERHGLLQEYRRVVLERAVSEIEEATRERRFEERRRFVDDAFALARTEEERREVGEAAREFYASYARRLEGGDPGKYLSLCREMVERFPDDPEARRLLERGYLFQLQEEIGDLSSSFRRFSTRELFQVFRNALSRVRSEDVVREFQDYLARIRDEWTRQLDRVDEPEEGLRLAAQVGLLAGWSEEETLARGARAVARAMTNAAHAGRWSLVERSITLWFRECPLEPRPWNFEEIHIRLLSHLDGNDLIEDLARHVAYFLAAFPDDRNIARQFVERLESEAPETLAIFEETLQAMEKVLGTDELDDRDEVVEREDDGVEDGSSVEPDDGAGTDVASEQERPVDVTDSSPAEGDPRGSARDGRKPRPRPAWSSYLARQGRRHPAGRTLLTVEAAGCAFLVLLLLVVTVFRGPCRFRWYALAALWSGVTAGSAVAF